MDDRSAEPSEADGEATARVFGGRPLQIPKAAEIVAGRLRREIVRRQIQPGQTLPPETRLMEQLNVSRPTLREALRMLEAEQLIEIHRGARGGARVRRPDRSAAAGPAGLLLQVNGVSLEDVLTAQSVLECGVVQLLASDPDVRSVQHLREFLVEEEAALDDGDRYSACAIQFHEQLVSTAGNESTMLLAGVLKEIVDRHTKMVALRQPPSPARRPSWRTRSHAVHTELVDLIEAGDGAQAEDLLRRHNAASRRVILSELDGKDLLELY
jgi:DNA-binding FadR family transcriptional regulator